MCNPINSLRSTYLALSDGVRMTALRDDVLARGGPIAVRGSVPGLHFVTIRRYVVPSHWSMPLRARRRSAQTVKSRRNGGTGRIITRDSCGHWSSVRRRPPGDPPWRLCRERSHDRAHHNVVLKDTCRRTADSDAS